ncbi:uncharacterized protein JCM6883_006681 [Sporobolomyces salmoneus]|uniref:uncharacterized protein n=1 Tax=Sporobolomyces salmoneus TaxID=183962 RepID=UPI003176795D
MSTLKEEERAETPLDRYFTSLKPESTDSSFSSKPSRPGAGRRNPKQQTLSEATSALKQTTSKTEGVELNKSLNKAIRSTLGQSDNPVTNSTAYGRTMHIQSCATGHQGGGGGGKGWSLHRNQKLAYQAAEKETGTLRGVVGYLSGYSGEESTNLELKACVERQGGRWLTMANGSCTHIFTTSHLSGSKAQKYFESNKKNKYKLVLPAWAFECERVGKRVSEVNFVAPIKHELQGSIFEIYKSTSSNSNSHSHSPSTSTSAASLLLTTTSNAVASTSSSSSTRPVVKCLLPVQESRKEEETIILSPSPSPKSPQKKKRKSTDSAVATSKSKKRSSTSTKKSPPKEKEKEKKREEEKLEELLILGSSDVEIEDESLAIKRGERPSKEKKRKIVEEEDEEELDEFGMPPSAQRR